MKQEISKFAINDKTYGTERRTWEEAVAKTLAVLLALVLIITGAGTYARDALHRETSAPPVTENATDDLSVYFFNVGQGDSMLIDRGEYECLVDSGDGATDLPSILKPYVQGRIEDIVSTHSHEDHVGGMVGVFKGFQVQNFWYNGEASDTLAFKAMLNAANAEAHSTLHITKAGDKIQDGPLSIEVLDHGGSLGANNNSVVLEVVYGSTSFLLMGDTEIEGEQALEGQLHDINILKVGHHGSCTSSWVGFLHAVQPEIAIYSAGIDNQYSHPCATTLDHLQDVGARVYGTDVDGTIRVTTDGATYQVATDL